jgi:hypothetical protein
LPGAIGKLVGVKQLVVVVDEVLGDCADVHEKCERPSRTFCMRRCRREQIQKSTGCLDLIKKENIIPVRLSLIESQKAYKRWRYTWAQPQIPLTF